MIIIGAGVAGAMARGYFSSLYPKVYEASKTSEKKHKAIMRYKDFSIAYLLGVPFEKVKISKAIYYRGSFLEPNPAMLNSYSFKVSQGIFSRSIQSIEPAERFIAREEYVIPFVEYGKVLVKVKPNKCFFSDGTEVEYDTCISTIPLPVMASVAEIELGNTKIKKYPICVAQYPVKIPCDIFQTIYFPDLDIPIYRASLERQKLTVECLGEDNPDLREIDFINAFGLSFSNLGTPEISIQSMGKIVDMDDTIRRKTMTELTKKYNIYSLGRYATWKNITTEALLKDLEVISKMIGLSKDSREYELRLGGVK